MSETTTDSRRFFRGGNRRERSVGIQSRRGEPHRREAAKQTRDQSSTVSYGKLR